MANQPNQPIQDGQPSAGSGQARKMQIKITDDVLKGSYANAMQVSHTQEEFLLDFMNLTAHQGVGIINARVIISPGHLKRIIAAMQQNLKIYEEKHGPIKVADAPTEIGFKAK